MVPDTEVTIKTFWTTTLIQQKRVCMSTCKILILILLDFFEFVNGCEE